MSSVADAGEKAATVGEIKAYLREKGIKL